MLKMLKELHIYRPRIIIIIIIIIIINESYYSAIESKKLWEHCTEKIKWQRQAS